MAKINIGRINENNNYEKLISFSKAVLWKDRQLSIPCNILDNLVRNRCLKMIYTDRKKGEKWIFKTSEVMEKAEFKREGQEPQYYFPIELAKIEKI